MKNIITQTENYAIVRVGGGADGHGDWDGALTSQLDSMEWLLSQGYRPLHYLPRFSGWVCEKLRKAKAA